MTRMPFGKHKGQPLAAIEDAYLEWALGIATSDWLIAAIEDELGRRAGGHGSAGPPPPPPPPPPDAWQALVDEGRRTLAKRYHPDHNGNGEVMKGINVLADWLKKQTR